MQVPDFNNAGLVRTLDTNAILAGEYITCVELRLHFPHHYLPDIEIWLVHLASGIMNIIVDQLGITGKCCYGLSST